METGTIASWEKQVGEELAVGDVIAEIQTDKAVVGFEVQEEGFLAAQLQEAGTEVAVNAPVAVIVEDADDVEAFASITLKDLGFDESGASSAAAAAASESSSASESSPSSSSSSTSSSSSSSSSSSTSSPTSSPTTSSTSTSSPPASPLARRLARDHGLELGMLAGKGSGFDGLVVAGDVREFLESGVGVGVGDGVGGGVGGGLGGGDWVDVSHSEWSRELAETLSRSKRSVPHYYQTVRVELDRVLELREQFGGGELSVMDFVLKAMATASKRVPEANSSWLPHGVRTYDYVDVSVGLVGGDGAVVYGSIKDVDQLGLGAIHQECESLREAAANDTLSAQQRTPGTISVINVGAYGVKTMSPIILPPMAAALAIGTTEQTVIPTTTTSSTSSTTTPAFRTATTLHATLSCDHRVLDGAVAASWLAHFKTMMQQPESIIL